MELFSGVGGFSIGFERAGMECVGHCEIDEYAQKILKKNFPSIPLYSDVRKLKRSDFGKVDLICGGFPCPAFSYAGKKGGFKQDDLFFELLRLIKEIKPKWVVMENVEGITKWTGEIKDAFKTIGYEISEAILDARDFGIPQSRRRWFGIGFLSGMLSSPQYLRWVQRKKSQNLSQIQPNLTNTKGRWTPTLSSKEEWRAVFANATRSREDNGVPNKSHRLRCLGNAVIPKIAEFLGKQIMEIEEEAKN